VEPHRRAVHRATTERYDLVNRLCEAEDLDHEVAALTEVLLSRDPHTTTVTKCFVDKGADLGMHASLYFQGASQRFAPGQRGVSRGIVDFADMESREARRNVGMNFWQD
jgi:hypothetical protein